MPGDESSLLTPARKTHIDVVHSEDIDGPTDFTQNLEYWMLAKLPHSARATVTRPTTMGKGVVREGLEEFVSSSDDGKRLEEWVKRGPREETPEVTGLSGIGDSSPRTVERVGLRASVEDYEDTPLKMASERRASSSAIGATLRSPEHTLRTKPAEVEEPEIDEAVAEESVEEPHQEGAILERGEEDSETVKSLCDALEKLKGELEDVRIHSQREVARLRDEHTNTTTEQREARSKQIQKYTSAFSDRLLQAEAEHRKGLEDLRAQFSQQSNQRDSHIGELRNQLSARAHDLESSDRKNGESQRDLETLQEKYRIQNEEFGEEKRESAKKYASLLSAFEPMEASKLDAQDKVEDLEAELAHLKLEHQSRLDDATSRLEDAENRTAQAVRDEKDASRETIAQLESENAMLHDQLDGKDDEIEREKTKIAELKRQLVTARDEKSALVEKAKEQRSLNEQAAREILSLRSGNKLLQSQLKESSASLSSTTQDMHSLTLELKTSHAATATAKKEASDSQDETALAHAEILQMKDDYAVVNKAVDKKMRDVMKSRELEWSKRFDVLEKEMGLRGRVLMKEWGARETGESEPQGYRYKYV